ncbi:MAG TPA: ATP synthase subunit I [Acetobacteraceae bacterium]|nr:ATP synthase subunit I [Acetobacteraceae bacterium]
MSAAASLPGAFWLLAGAAGGTAHFALLRWNTRLYLAGGGVARALGVQALRMAATGALLGFAAWHGGVPLLLATIGVSLARLLVLRVVAVVP